MTILSIIIPHYNSPKQLKRLLKSIPRKENIEIIVVDDKSNKYTDEYKRLVFDFDYVLFLENSSMNKGAGACRNIGLKKAKGDWILFADSDDYFVEGFYKTIKKYMGSYKDVVFFVPTSKDILTGEISDRHLPYKQIIDNFISKGNTESLLKLRYNFFVPWSKLINKMFISKYNITFDETIASNDVMFSTKVGHYMKSFDISRETIYCVTKGVGTLTKNTDEKTYNARVAVHIDYCNYLYDNLEDELLSKMQLSGRSLILKAVNYRYGINKIIDVYLLFKKNNIRVFNCKDLNIISVIYKLIKHKKKHKKDQNYYE